MNIKKTLIVYKKSAYQTYFMEYKHANFIRLARSGDKGLTHIKQSHHVHYHTLDRIENILDQHGIKFEHRYRGKSFNENNYDLIISVGGDGTFLDAARNIKTKPILGINSDISHSVGRFCSAHKSNFEEVFENILKDKFKIMRINRMEIKVNNEFLNRTILNDILICHACPAAMSHYIVSMNGKEERQRSSGMWISTAAGSTGGIRSAGGEALSLESGRFQYMPRELYDGHGIRYRLKGGKITQIKTFEIRSQMQEGMIYTDGAHYHAPFKYGDRLNISISKAALNAIFF